MMAQRLLTTALLAGAALFVGSAASAPAARPDVEPEALQAVQRMVTYLGTLQTFEVKSDATEELVLDNGQKLQFGRQVDYVVHRPNNFLIKSQSDRKARDFYYDGHQFTVLAPRAGLYATAPAPGTIRALLDDASKKYGIELPLEDLFTWGQAGDDTASRLKSGYHIGYAKVGGQEADQYAFRGPYADWQVWIRRGAEPVPLKLVITDRTDPARPQYAATLQWNLKPALAADEFTLHPTKDMYRIRISSR
jgi:hypothetical protein